MNRAPPRSPLFPSTTLFRSISAGAAALGCLLLAPAALAADGESTPLNLDAPAKDVAAGSSSGGLVRTIVGLAVVLGVIYGLHWVLKQVKSAKDDKASGQGLAPLATLPLGPNRSLQLVRAGSEIVLLGVGEGGVTPIRTYTEDQARSLGLLGEPLDERPALPAPRPSFRTALDELRRRTVINK